MEDASEESATASQAEWEMNSLFHRCARLLPLNGLSDLLSLSDILIEVCTNVCNEPDNTKFHRIRVANKTMQTRIFSRQGGLEFLGAIGFRAGLLGGEKHLILDSPVLHPDGRVLSAADCVKDRSTGAVTTVFESVTSSSVHSSSSSGVGIRADVERIRIGLNWLKETVATCVTMHGLCINMAAAEGGGGSASGACAETFIQVRLPGGLVTQGGFTREDTVEDVLQFARCFFRVDKATDVVLRLPYDAAKIMNDDPFLTLDQAKLHPRAVLVASTDTTIANRAMKISDMHVKVKENIQSRLAAAVKAKEVKLAQQERERRHRESVLLSFRDDRDDVKEKRKI